MDVSKEDIYVVTKRVRKWPIKTTVDWKILVQFEDKYEYLIHLKDMKESHPVEFGDFYKARGITDEPTFLWWFPYTLRKIDVILCAVKHHIRNTTQKYGIELNTTVE